jgi:hypothetical protein
LLAQPASGPLSRPVEEWPGAASATNVAKTPSMIAHYRITAKIGEGGMGAVYRSTDTKLGREVAIKFLRPSLAGDAQYMARFQREAKVLASPVADYINANEISTSIWPPRAMRTASIIEVKWPA